MEHTHLQRTGYRHGVFAIVAASALVSAMWALSAFAQPISKTQYDNTAVMKHAFAKASRFGQTIVGLNLLCCVITTLMAMIVDWHLDVRIPAYAEYFWVGLLWCVELVAVVLGGVSNPTEVCWLERTAGEDSATFSIQSALGKSMCTTWKGMFSTSVIALGLLTIHFVWHFIFRLWHRRTLGNRQVSPVHIWVTPLPRGYPITAHETPKAEDHASSAPGSGPMALDPYSLFFFPPPAGRSERNVEESMSVQNGTRNIPSVIVTAQKDDPEKAGQRTSALPPGLNVVTNGGVQEPRST